MGDNLDKNRLNRIGCHCWGTNPLSVDSLPVSAQAGCRWVRATRQVQMEVVSTARRQYDFAAAGERSIDLAIANGMSIMGILDGRWGNETRVNKLPWASPIWERLDEWEHFVAACVEHYKDRIKYWEVINEPPFFWWYPAAAGETFPEVNPDMKRAPIWAYAKLLQATARAVRAADSEAKIVAGSTFSDGAFLRSLYKLGCRDSFDIASVHYLNCKHPDDFAKAYRQVRSVMAAYGDQAKPLWDTENGPGGAVIGCAVKTRDEYQGLYNVYRHCFAHELGLERYFWFNPVRAPEAGVGNEHGIATHDAQGRLSSAYQALHNLVQWVGEGRLLRREHIDREVHLYVFQGPQGPCSILWATAPATARINPGAEATDYLGLPVQLESEFELTGRPVFIRGDIASAGFGATVKGPRQTVTPVAADKQPAPATPTITCPRAKGAMGMDDPAWDRMSPAAGRDQIAAPAQRNHFCKVPSSVPAELKMAYDDQALYLRVRTWDDKQAAGPATSKQPTGLIQFTVRDGNPAVTEWPFFFNSYGLFNLYASPRGPMFLRYDPLYVDEYQVGPVPAVPVEVKAAEGGVIIWAKVPWNQIGPCRPGKHEPFLMMFTFNRADNMIDVPAGDTPEEWSHNFADAFIVKDPALIRWVKFE